MILFSKYICVLLKTNSGLKNFSNQTLEKLLLDYTCPADPKSIVVVECCGENKVIQQKVEA